ncbi:hypothetical protein FM069_07855 [Pseudomonas mangiferae]|uniref:Conjugal transfer protein TrbC n=1 Tax=Pseudomonas mangiferae TaxID=2593654 RepID=A0A553H1Q1_9PSED|nr:hypothetical protein FM069_07855 [Pseudomonas mangiferae]
MPSTSSVATPAGKAGGQSVGKHLSLASVLALGAVSVNAHAAFSVPSEVIQVFTDLGAAVGTLMAAAAMLFGLIRGGTAIFKIASKFFGAAGA